MSPFASTAGWNAQSRSPACAGSPRRALEIAGIVFGFIYAWPLALAYLLWKAWGYPVPAAAKGFFDGGFFAARPSPFTRPAWTYPGTGNAAFEEYRRAELARLEEERRRLDEEAHAFRDFVEELKRAKDREEFDAFMAKRRAQNGPTTAV